MAAALLACSPFRAEDETTGSADAHPDRSDERVEGGTTGDGASAPPVSPCLEPGWGFCDDFDGDAGPSAAVWKDAGATNAIALDITSEQHASPPRSLKVYAASPPASGDQTAIAESLRGDGKSGIECTIAVLPDALSEGETRVLALSFGLSAVSQFSYAEIALSLKQTAGATSASLLAELLHVSLGAVSTTPVTTVLDPGWNRIIVRIDFSAKSTLQVASRPALDFGVRDIGSFESVTARVGALTIDPTGRTLVYLDDVACKTLP